MIFIELFLTFLKIGAVSFGGGYGMISLIREEVLLHGWMTEEEFLNMIAVSESTPGPIAVNMATFIGSQQGGVFGALLATLGVVIPSFVIILLISIALKNLMKYRFVKAALSGIRPAVIGLILATAAALFLSTFLSVSHITDHVMLDLPALIIFCVLAIASPMVKKVFRKKLPPIFLIVLSAVLGMVLYSI